MADLPGGDGGNNAGGAGQEFHRRERKNYYVALSIGRTGTGSGNAATNRGGGQLKIPFRGVAALYGDIKTTVGVEEITESDNVLSDLFGIAGKMLPKLRIGLAGGGANNTGIGNQAQSDSNSSATLFVNPDNISEALRNLQGKTAYGKRITTVRIPRRRVYV